MRTLSTRILLGFTALTITFGVITATVVVNMRQVEDQVLLIGNGYVPLALESKDLARRQDDLRNHLEERFDESTLRQVQNLTRLRRNRDNGLKATRRILDNVEKLVDVDPKQFAVTRPRLESLERGVAALDPLYGELMAIAPTEPGTPHDPKRAAQMTEILAKLRTEERKLWAQTNGLSDQLERSVARTTSYLEDNEHTLRIRTIYLGITAVTLGLLVTVWVVITLRPLRRLRDGARRIAAGDYASRISEKGPAEVADLAREFNSMGRAVEERERELVRSERLAAVGKMAAMIAHEVRNPLSSIGLNTELLADEIDELGDAGDSAEARSLCRSIHREVDRLTQITEEYLALARLPKPKLAPEPINPLVTALVSFVREDLAAKQVALETELASGELVAPIDASQIRQCLITLVRNAADAVKDREGRVVLRTRSVPGRVEIDVEDNGVGIAPDVLPRLFDPFFSTKEGGNGLGLALTHQIVRDHGGELRVDSAVGRGTTFTVSLPVGG